MPAEVTAPVVLFTPVGPRPSGALLIGANCVDASDPAGAPYVIRPYRSHSDVVAAADQAWDVALGLTSRIGAAMGRHFSTEWPSPSWAALLLPWAAAWSENLYDRYLRLAWLREHAPEAQLLLPTVAPAGSPYRVSLDVWASSVRHGVNAALYHALTREMGMAGRVIAGPALDPEPDDNQTEGAGWKVAARRLALRLLGGRARDPLTRAAGYSAELRDDGFDRVRDARSVLRIDPEGGEFARIAARLAPAFLPLSLFEEFPSRRAYAEAFVKRRRVRLLNARSRFWGHETLKYVMAEVRRQGGRVVTEQHGGGYGMYDVTMPERVERRVANAYITWGWEDDRGGRLLPLPNPRLSSMIDTHRPASDAILYLGTHGPKYVFRYQPYLMPEFVHDHYIPMQAQFLRALGPELQRRLRYRLYPGDYGWQERERTARVVPGIRFDTAPTSVAGMQAASLVVIDHPATSLLEALVINVPTVLYWHADQGTMREIARPSLGRLRAAGVLHDTAESAAAHVAAVATDPAAWWRRSEVQDARRAFCRQFAWADRGWKESWRRAAASIAS